MSLGQPSISEELFEEASLDPNKFVFGLGASLDPTRIIEEEDITKLTGGDLQLPSLQLPQLPEIQGVKIEGPEGPRLEGPEGVSLDTPSITGPDIDIDISDLKLPGANIDIDLPELNLPEISESVPLPNLQPIADVIEGSVRPIAETAKPVLEVTGEVAGGIATAFGAGITNVPEVIGRVSQPVVDAIADTLGVTGEALGETIDSLRNTSIVQGTGEGYGQVQIGQTGFSIDVSKNLDSSIDDLLKGTAIEGAKGSDIFELATDPQAFVKRTGQDQAANLISSIGGLDEGFAKDVVSALDNPEEFVKNKGAKEASNFVKKSTGIKGGTAESGAVGGAIEAALSGGNIVEAAAKGAATSATINVVSGVANAIIPGSGFIISALASVFNYSCYLSTAAYYDGFINKNDYLMFTRYRLNIQSKEKFSKQIWLGYIIFFEKLFHYQLKFKKVNEIITNHITLPWLKYIRYKLGKGKFNFRGYISLKLIKLCSLATYYLLPKTVNRRKSEVKYLNIMKVYKDIIRVISKGRTNVSVR